MTERGRATSWRKLLFGALGATVLAGSYVAFGGPYWPGADEAVPLTTEVVARDIEEAIVVNGVLEPAQMVNVGAQVSGQIKALHVVLGQQVKAGQLVAEIDSLPQQSALRLAEASLALARAQRDARAAGLKQVQSDYDRQQALLDANATSRAKFEAAEAAFRTAVADVAALDAQIERSKIEVEIAQTNLAYTKVVAPIDGTIIAIATKQGQTLNSSQAAPTVVVVAQLDVMSVKVQISEAEIGKVKVGQEVWFTLLGDERTRYSAQLDVINPAPQTLLSQSDAAQGAAVYFNGLFKVDNVEGRLRPLMTAQVHLVTGRASDVPAVLSSALGTSEADGQYRVEVLTDEGPRETLVRIGLNDKTNAQVIDGLNLGDQVILPLGEVAPTADPMLMGEPA